MEFLAGNNFDFNKVFNQGISYVRQSNATQLHEKCVKWIAKNLAAEASALSNAGSYQRQLDELLSQVNSWANDRNSANRLTLSIPSYNLRKALTKLVARLCLKAGIVVEL